MLKCLFLTVFLLVITLSTGIPLLDESSKAAKLTIGSFNIQSLGPTKMGRPEFVSSVVKILAKYDIVLIQEIKDATTTNVMNQLKNELNLFVKYYKKGFNDFFYRLKGCFPFTLRKKVDGSIHSF
jgi:hypothetical protein